MTPIFTDENTEQNGIYKSFDLFFLSVKIDVIGGRFSLV